MRGYVNIVGRIKDMVIRAARNLYPTGSKNFCTATPGAGCAGGRRAGQKYGEELCAWIIAKPGSSRPRTTSAPSARSQIAHYKVPRYIRFVQAR